MISLDMYISNVWSFSSRDWEGHVTCSECIVSWEKSTEAVVASISSLTKIAEQAGRVSKFEFNGVGGLRAYTGLNCSRQAQETPVQ